MHGVIPNECLPNVSERARLDPGVPCYADCLLVLVSLPLGNQRFAQSADCLMVRILVPKGNLHNKGPQGQAGPVRKRSEDTRWESHHAPSTKDCGLCAAVSQEGLHMEAAGIDPGPLAMQIAFWY